MSQNPYRTFSTTVERIVPLSPSFTRITFTGDDLQHFGTDCLDQRIKLIIPFPDGSYTDFGQFDESKGMFEWYGDWRLLPDEERNPIRTYTVRAVRPEMAEVDIDFVLHGTNGPASAWATGARVGDRLAIVGPDARAMDAPGGIEWKPGTATSFLIAGDETAAPAICSIVESLPPHVTGDVFIEVPTSADALPLTAPTGIRVTWLGRDGGAHGSLLTPAVHAWGARRQAAPATASAETEESTAATDEVLWDVPETSAGTEYAWLAGEAGTITSLRRHLVRDLGIDRRSIAFMGYWRIGRAES